MAITHGIALAFSVIFVILGATFKTFMFWIVSLGYILVLAVFAVINSWEILFFAPLIGFGIISIVGLIYSAVNGELI